jgi:RNA recognition motif-containing protein
MSQETAVQPAEASPDSNSKKRKSHLAEIEVDVSAPEPPSKKTRRALKKGKPLPPKPSSDNESKRKKNKNKAESKIEIDSEDDDEEKKESVKKSGSEHSVWIGNLPFTVTKEKLMEWLVDNSGGAILGENITRVKLPKSKDKAPPRGRDNRSDQPANRGFAYVDFDGIGPQMAAIALSENELGGRNLLIKDAKSYEGRPKKKDAMDEIAGAAGAAGDDAAKDANRKVFVGNLSFAVTEDDLWSHFQKCGEIDWVKVATFEDTGKCKGFGWIKFREPAGAAWAVKGFVKIKEDIETEEDFADKKVDAEGDGKDNDESTEPRKTQTRKWWVNRLQGRALKIELAEEDQVRYKKRFGKDAQKKQPGKAVGDGEEATKDIVADATKAAMAVEAAAA